jgi:hypothetical protein
LNPRVDLHWESGGDVRKVRQFVEEQRRTCEGSAYLPTGLEVAYKTAVSAGHLDSPRKRNGCEGRRAAGRLISSV